MLKAVFPGSFDPPTNGHLNLIERASAIFDETDVVIAVNKMKTSLFTSEERFALMSELIARFDNVKLFIWDRLIVEFAEKTGAKILLRGVRALADFGYEFELAMTNRGLLPSIETMFLPTDPKFFVLRASAIREIASFGGDVTSMVPPVVAEALKRKLFGA
jgi:pantetheine-phosphate adenylyltransferase